MASALVLKPTSLLSAHPCRAARAQSHVVSIVKTQGHATTMDGYRRPIKCASSSLLTSELGGVQLSAVLADNMPDTAAELRGWSDRSAADRPCSPAAAHPSTTTAFHGVVESLVYSDVSSGLAAMGWSFATMRALAMPVEWPLLLLAFLSVHSTYLQDRIKNVSSLDDAVNMPARTAWVEQHRTTLKQLVKAELLLSALLVCAKPLVLPSIMIGMACAWVYTSKFLPGGRSLKQLPGFKVLYVAFLWTMLCVGLPCGCAAVAAAGAGAAQCGAGAAAITAAAGASAAQLAMGAGAATAASAAAGASTQWAVATLLGGACMLCTMAQVNISDIRDIEGDTLVGTKTLAVLLGAPAARMLSVGMAASACLLGLATGATAIAGVGLYVGFAVACGDQKKSAMWSPVVSSTGTVAALLSAV